MITRKQKEELVTQLKDILENSKSVVFTSFDGINVEDQRSYRKLLKDKQSDYKVFKKTLIQLVLKDTDYEVDFSQAKGSIGIAYSNEDEIVPIKESVEFSKDQETFKSLGCLMDGQIVEGDDLKRLADLPSKEVLQAQVVGTIAAPLNGFVNVLAGNMRGLVNVLKAKAEAN